MKSRAIRTLLVVLALAIQAGAGYKVWLLEQQTAKERSEADEFDRKARLAVTSLAEWRGAQQAYVAEGQSSDTWQTRATEIGNATTPKLSELRVAARTADAQGLVEGAIENLSALAQTDAKARDYIRSGQRLSASDVIFTDGASLMTKVGQALDTARGQERVARETTIAGLRQVELYVIAGAAGLTLLVLLILIPIPRSDAAAGDEAEAEEMPSAAGGLGISQSASVRPVKAAAAPPPAASEPSGSVELDRLIEESAGPDLAAVADICSAFAKVEDPRELHGLLERTAKVLEASGLIIWMPEGAQGPLRPVLAYGYAPLALTRMGAIEPLADNATAVAFRTRALRSVSADPLSSGAIVAPLVTSDGCSGTMAVELKQGVHTTPRLCAVASILAAQLATLITPSTQSVATISTPQK